MGRADTSDPRDESEAERDDSNLAELLQELRVAGLGVQVLFGFLLSLPFTNRFARLSQGQRRACRADHCLRHLHVRHAVVYVPARAPLLTGTR